MNIDGQVAVQLLHEHCRNEIERAKSSAAHPAPTIAACPCLVSFACGQDNAHGSVRRGATGAAAPWGWSDTSVRSAEHL